MIVFLYIAFLVYFLAMLWIVIGFLMLPKFKASNSRSSTQFTIIIPLRNEAENLPSLLDSIMALHYPIHLFEVLFVDDASEDNSKKILEHWQSKVSISCKIIQNKRNSGSPKKDAITLAINKAKHQWILTTDADCVLPESWLRSYDQIIQKKKPKMICAPVVYPYGKIGLRAYQFLDGLSLQAAAIGSFGWKKPLLCNGANMGYLKSAFLEINGYEGNNEIASGDDIFLLEKMTNRFSNEVTYLKSNKATVVTQSETSWKAVISQRIRWASKTTKQKNAQSKVLGIIVFLGNLAFMVSLGILIWDSRSVHFLLAIVGFKIVVDFIVLSMTGQLLRRSISIFHFLVNTVIYPPLALWIFFNSLRGNYQWKGRKFKK